MVLCIGGEASLILEEREETAIYLISLGYYLFGDNYVSRYN